MYFVRRGENVDARLSFSRDNWEGSAEGKKKKLIAREILIPVSRTRIPL